MNNCDAGKFHSDLERQLRIRVHNALLDLTKSRQIERMKHDGQYLYLSIDEVHRKKQIEQRDKLSVHIRRLPGALSEPLVIEVLAEVIRQSGQYPRPSQVASALADKGLPITDKDVANVFDDYDIEKKTSDLH